MSTNTIYITLGVVFAAYLVISMTTRGRSKARKSRKFMDDYKRKKKNE